MFLVGAVPAWIIVVPVLCYMAGWLFAFDSIPGWLLEFAEYERCKPYAPLLRITARILDLINKAFRITLIIAGIHVIFWLVTASVS